MFDNLPKEVTVFEVGPRDGLQNESKHIETADKVALIEAIAQAGLKQIEVTSFVSPKWIPQLADGAQVIASLSLPTDVSISALVPNLKGYEAAKASGLKQINLFLSASEAHSKKNINKSVAEALSTMKEVADVALQDGMRLRCYVSTVFACPYEGPVSINSVLKVVEGLVSMGVHEISLGDTIGAANPLQVKQVLDALKGLVSFEKLALHFHDTRGTALANVVAGIESGVTIFDSSLGGLGGCPYAPGASGNLATEDLVYMLHGMGIKTGIDLPALIEAGALAQKLLGKELPGRYLRAELAARAKACAKVGAE
ncbi:MAG: hydroxymethylglutaryl-CoA lyase [Candidatus Melainabacteria bacterium]|jgi:hydroxymethylglutaryl-CoA lyase|nr:hydroxymethylglutaryl-CoA lyase [Candidatus Melainabacteria bacterium]